MLILWRPQTTDTFTKNLLEHAESPLKANKTFVSFSCYLVGSHFGMCSRISLLCLVFLVYVFEPQTNAALLVCIIAFRCPSVSSMIGAAAEKVIQSRRRCFCEEQMQREWAAWLSFFKKVWNSRWMSKTRGETLRVWDQPGKACEQMNGKCLCKVDEVDFAGRCLACKPLLTCSHCSPYLFIIYFCYILTSLRKAPARHCFCRVRFGPGICKVAFSIFMQKNLCPSS